MAQLTPKGTTQEQAPNFLGSSRGAPAPSSTSVQADTSGSINPLGGLVGGAGTLFNLGVNAVDRHNQDVIKEDLSASINKEQQDFNTSNIATLFGKEAGVTVPQVPSEIRRSGRQLEGLTTAVRSGRMKESSYWSRINSIARSLRHRYPEYKDQIDQMTSSLVGTNPANALRRSLASEARAAQSQSTGNKLTPVQKFVNSNLQDVPPSYFVNPENFSLLSLQEATAKRKRLKADIELSKSSLSLSKLQGDQVQEDSFKLANRELNTQLDDVLDTVAGSVANNTDDFFAQLSQVQDKGDKATPEELVQLREGFSRLKLERFNQITETLSQDTYDNLTPSQRKQLTDQHMGVLDGAEKALADKDFGLFGAIIARTKMHNDANTAKLAQLPDVQIVNAIRGALGPELSQSFFDQNRERLKAVDVAVRESVLSKVLNGDVSLSEGIDKSKEAGIDGTSKDGKKYFRSLIDRAVEGAINPNVPLDVYKKTITSLYGNNNNSFISNFSQSNQQDMFLKLSNPQVSKKIFQLRNSNPELWKSYKDWTLTTARALGITLANSVKEIRVNRRFLDVTFKNNQFSLVPVKAKNQNRLTPTARTVVRGIENASEALFGDEERAKGQIEEFNKYLRAIDSVFSLDQSTGGDTGSFMQQVLARNFDFPLNTPKDKSTVESLIRMMTDAIGTTPSPNKAQNQ